MLDVQRISELKDKHGVIVIATIVKTSGSSPRNIGAKMIISPDGKHEGTIGGGQLERLVILDALAQLKIGGCSYKEYKLTPEDEKGIGTECGGDVHIFIEVIGQCDHLVIIGAGHIGHALYKLARTLNFSIAIIDDRPEYAVPETFPGADVRLSTYDNSIIPSLITKDSYVVIVTHQHMNDTIALKNVLNSKPKYIGMIGSRRKVEKLKGQLLNEGFSKDVLDEIYTPVGLDIGAETPAEIAVSILSEIIHIKRKGTPSQIGMGRKL